MRQDRSFVAENRVDSLRGYFGFLGDGFNGCPGVAALDEQLACGGGNLLARLAGLCLAAA